MLRCRKLHCNSRLFCSAEVIWTKSCAAANEKLHCNIEKAALQESGAFLLLSCGFQAPTFRHPRFGPAAECTKIAHRRSLAIFTADSGIAGNSAVGIKFVPFNRRENRRSLAIFFAEEIAHLGALKIARFCGGAVKIAAAENRAILVHSDLLRSERAHVIARFSRRCTIAHKISETPQRQQY